MEGSRFYPNPVCTHILQNPAFIRWACASRRLPRTSPGGPTTHRDSLRLLPIQRDQAKLHRETRVATRSASQARQRSTVASAPRLRVFRTKTSASCPHTAHCSPSDFRGCDSSRNLDLALLPPLFAQRQTAAVSSAHLLQAGSRDRSGRRC